MSRVLPYRVAPPSYVGAEPWHIHTEGEEPVPLGDHLPDWDYNTDLHLTRMVEAEPERIRAECGLPADAPLVWSIVWRATDTKLTSAAPNVAVTASPTTLSARIAGHDLGVDIELMTRIVLAAPQPSTPTVAAAAGSILWHDEERVNLVGDGARFPIAVIDFEAAFLDPDASLALEIDDDLETPLLGGLQLLINSRDDELVAAVQKPAGSSQVRAHLLATVDEFVMTQLLDFARRHGDDLETFSGEDDSIGAMCLNLLDQTVPIRTLSELHEWRHARYQATLAGEARRRGMGRQIG